MSLKFIHSSKSSLCAFITTTNCLNGQDRDFKRQEMKVKLSPEPRPEGTQLNEFLVDLKE